MKLHFNVKTLAGDIVSLDLTVTPQDTVKMIKERIAMCEPNPFPDQEMLLEGKELHDEMKLSECNVQDGGVLDFMPRATEDALVGQLEELLRISGPVSVQELVFSYALQHGVTIGLVLQALGKNQTLESFLERFGKRFIVENGLARLSTPVPKEVAHSSNIAQFFTLTVLVALQMPSVTWESTHELSVQDEDTVRSVKESAAAAAQVPFLDCVVRFGSQLLEEGGKRLREYGITKATKLELVVTSSEQHLVGQFAAILLAQGSMSRMELDNAFCLCHGLSASQSLQMLGWNEKLQQFIERHPTFSVEKGCIRLTQVSPKAVPCAVSDDNHAYLALHAKLCDMDFSEQASRALDAVADAISSETFLSISRIVRGGAVAKGTAIPGAAGAELVLFLNGLPPTGQEVWLSGLAKSVASGLNDRLCGQAGIVEVHSEHGAIRLCTDGPLGDVLVFLSPTYACYADAVAALGKQADKARGAGAAAFAAQRVRFVERQPRAVKATMQLMKWWRQQRQWSSDATRPSDELLELAVAHATSQCTPRDLRDAVSKVLSVLSKFNDLKVTWPLALRSFPEKDIWKPLLQQQPLMMDPANPFANVADPHVFQAHELVEYAQSGRFF